MKKAIAKIEWSFIDFPENNTVSLNVYIPGCSHYCPECHNPELQDPLYKDTGSKYYTPYDLYFYILSMSSGVPDNINFGVALMGGDPLYDDNTDFVNEFLNINDKPVIIYTGYNIIEAKRRLNTNKFTFLKCGLFKKALYVIPNKTNEYMQFASTNQELYDNNFNLLSYKGKYSF